MILSTVAFALASATTPVVLETVKLNLNVGDKFTYKTTSETFSDMGSSNSKDTHVYEVTGNKDGVFQITSTTTEHEMESDGPGGLMTGNPKGMIVSYNVSPNRKMKGWKVVEQGGMSDEMIESMNDSRKNLENNGFQNFVMPDGDLKVGTKWEQKTQPPSMRFGGGGESTSEGDIEVKYEVVEFTGSGKDRVVVIKAKASGDIAMSISMDQGDFEIDMTISEKRKYWIRVSDGVLIKNESESEQVMSTAMGEFVMESVTKTELVKK